MTRCGLCSIWPRWCGSRGDRVRARDRRPRIVLRAVLHRGGHLAVGGSSRPGAPVDRRVDRRVRRGAGGRRGAGRAGCRRPCRADLSPRLTLLFDWLHLGAGSVWLAAWPGAGARVRRAARARMPARRRPCRASRPSLWVGAGARGHRRRQAVDHMPAVNALWQTGYGRAILVMTGLVGGADRVRQSVPLATPADRGGPRTDLGEAAARLTPVRQRRSRDRLGGGVRGGVLSSLPPPPGVRAENSAIAKVGPGRVARPSAAPATSAGAGLAEQGGRAGLVRAAHHSQAAAGPRSRRDAPVQPPRDGDADAGIPADRDAAGVYRARLRPS